MYYKFFTELIELMKKYEIKSISSLCDCDNHNHHIRINDDGSFEIMGLKFEDFNKQVISPSIHIGVNMKANNPIVIRPKTIITDFGYNNQTFSCRIKFTDRLKMLFSELVWFKMHGTQINKLAQGMEHNGLPFDLNT